MTQRALDIFLCVYAYFNYFLYILMVGKLQARADFQVQPATETVSETAPETGETGPETTPDAGDDLVWQMNAKRTHITCEYTSFIMIVHDSS